MEMVILVDKDDNQIGTMEKMEAHRKGELHRAFSVLVFNSKGEMLLQKRAKSKYHSGGLWTNACCSHPLPGEKMEITVQRRVREEIGIDINPKFSYKFLYKALLDQDLIEHELDHVFIAEYNDRPKLNSAEAEDWEYVSLQSLREDVAKNPAKYTYWFKLILDHPQMEKFNG
jgi:isopentenyl-diphosphate Delta-isomerase